MIVPALTVGLVVVSIGIGEKPAASLRPKTVVCTILPVFALTRDVAAGVEGVAIEPLIERPTGCPHDYALTTGDRKRLARAGLVLANGLGLERFLESVRQDGVAVVEVGVRCNVLHAGCAHAHDDGDSGHEHEQPNPHTWLSPAEAVTMTRAIGEALCQFDTANKERYAAGVARTVAKLEAVRVEYEAAAKRFDRRPVVAPAGVFDYVLRDLKVATAATYEAHEGAGVSPRALSDIRKSAIEKNAAVVVFEAGAAERLSATIAKECGLPAVRLDSMVGCERFPPEDDWFVGALRSNLRVMEKALAGDG